MGNSPLVSYVRLSPNHSGKRTHAIDRITPHCVVGQLSVEALGEVFCLASRSASCNYGIGADGRIGLYCNEWNRSWCSSSNANDQRAVTIECASDLKEPYAFKDIVYKRLIELCVDICRRNGKDKLIWIPNKTQALAYEPKANEMLITVHRWFANKSCPGDWLYSRLTQLANEVTTLLKKPSEKEGDDMAENRYNEIKELPEFAKPTIKKLCDKGIIKGKGQKKDADGRPADLNLSYDMLRLLVWNDRAGLYDE